MAKNLIGPSPFPLEILDLDGPISEDIISKLLDNRNSISICLRSLNGAEKRGGYFFHFKKLGNRFELTDFEGKRAGDFDLAYLVRLINHVSGRAFDLEVFELCQTEINLKQD